MFEFGPYWDTSTFLLLFVVFFISSMLIQMGKTHNVIVFRKKEESEGINLACFFVFVILLVLFTIRDKTVGADTPVYVDYFLSIKRPSFSISEFLKLQVNEPLFDWLCYVIRLFTSNYTLLFLACGVIIQAANVVFINNFWTENEDYLFILLVSVAFHYQMNVLRFALADAFLLFALVFLKRQRIGYCLLLSFLAIFFHVTSVINLGFLFLYYLFNKHYKKGVIVDNNEKRGILRGLMFLLILSAVVAYSSRAIILMTRFRSYVSNGGSLLGNIFTILTGVIAGIVYFKKDVVADYLKIALFISFFSVILIPFSIFLGAYRLTTFYFIPRLVVWGYYFNNYYITKTDSRVLKSIIVISLCVFYMLFSLSRKSSDIGFAYIIKSFV